MSVSNWVEKQFDITILEHNYETQHGSEMFYTISDQLRLGNFISSLESFLYNKMVKQFPNIQDIVVVYDVLYVHDSTATYAYGPQSQDVKNPNKTFFNHDEKQWELYKTWLHDNITSWVLGIAQHVRHIVNHYRNEVVVLDRGVLHVRDLIVCLRMGPVLYDWYSHPLKTDTTHNSKELIAAFEEITKT